MKKQFKKIYIEITNRCNLQCSFCPITKRLPRDMSIGEFEHILTEIKPYTDYIYLHVKGEPLAHPNLHALLDIADKHRFKVNITTNGTLLPKMKDILLAAKAIRQINISVHSFEGDNINALRNYVNRIIAFSKEAIIKTPILISLRLWNLKETTIMPNNLLVLELLEEGFDLQEKLNELLSDKAGIKLQNQLYLNQDYTFAWPDMSAPDLGIYGTCYGLRNQIAILSNGQVTPCCLDGEGIIDLGNIHTTSFPELLSNPRILDMQEGFRQNSIKEALCRRCGYRTRFNP